MFQKLFIIMNILLLLILLFSDIFAFLIYLDKHTVCVALCVRVCVLGARVRASVCMRVYLRVFACVCVRVLVCTCLVSRVYILTHIELLMGPLGLGASSTALCPSTTRHTRTETCTRMHVHAHLSRMPRQWHRNAQFRLNKAPIRIHTYVVCVYIIYIGHKHRFS